MLISNIQSHFLERILTKYIINFLTIQMENNYNLNTIVFLNILILYFDYTFEFAPYY
jgi:hypothetical protein